MTTRVLVVGAGPTGLTAAVELARRGAPVEVIERRPGPSQLSRAVGLLPASIAIFRASGTDAPVLDEAVPFSAFMVHRGARRLARLPLGFDATVQIRGLPQDRTEHHLAESFARYGGRVRYGTAFERLAQDGDGVSVTTSDGTARYARVIGADGVGSAVRRDLGLDYPGFELPGEWSIADVDCPGWPDPTAFKAYLLPAGNVAIVAPLAAARFRVIASRPDALAALPVPMPVTRTRRSDAFRISVRQVARYRVGRVFLAGDAAHCHSPVGGRGMNLGIGDAADLAARLTDGGLDGYEAARRAAGHHVIAISERGRRMVQSDSRLRRAALAGALRLAGAVPPLGRAAMRVFVTA